jgi:hypothetical protein
VFSELPVIPMLDIANLEPGRIMDHRMTKRGNAAVTQVLVKWSSLPDSMASWEYYYVLKNRFSVAPAWGHAGTRGGSNVTTDDTDGPVGHATEAVPTQANV